MTPLMIMLLVGAFVAGAAWWRRALIWVFVMLCIEGLPRLWLGDPAVLLVKDSMLLGIYVGFAGTLVTRRVNTPLPRVLGIPLLAFAALALMELLNPNLGDVWVGLVGVKSTLFYIPLVFVVQAVLPDSDAIGGFVEQLLFLSVPVCITGLVQFFVGPASYRELGGEFSEALFVTGGYVDAQSEIYRPNATFAWSGHYGAFLLFSSVLSLGVALAPRERTRRKWYVAITALNLTAALTSGQRALFVFLPLSLVVILLFHGLRVRMTLMAVCLVCVVVASTLLIAGPYVADRFLSMFEHPADSIVEDYGQAVLHNFSIASTGTALGSGLGSATPAARHVGDYTSIENHYAKTLYELGWAGLVVFLWLLGALLTLSWTTVRRTHVPWSHSLAAAIFAIQASVAVWGMTVCMLDFSVFALPFWGVTGVLARLSATGGSFEGAATAPVLVSLRQVSHA